MQENSSMLPTPGGPEMALLSSCASREVGSSAPSRLRFSVAGSRRSFWRALAFVILAGAALGLEFGLRAGGVAPPTGGESAKALSLDESGAAEISRLRDDLRNLRAQIEQLRHLAEISKTTERLKALEAAHDASVMQAQFAGSMTTRLGALEARLERLEHAIADATPTSVIQRPGLKKSAKDRQTATGAAQD